MMAVAEPVSGRIEHESHVIPMLLLLTLSVPTLTPNNQGQN